MMIRVLLTLLGLSVYVNASEPTTILGVLEDVSGHYVGQPNFRGVRVLFQKKGSDWQSFPSSCPDQACLKTIASEYPPAVTWTIGFSGRSLGRVTGRTLREFGAYADVGLQEITSQGEIPTIGKRSEEYGGFIGSPVFRPLIADSQPNFKDFESWMPSRPSSEVTAALRLRFRAKFPEVSNCTSGERDAEKPWAYRDTDIKIIKAYSSNRSWSVVQMLLAGYRCDGPLEGAFVNQWFAIGPRREIRFLGEAMWLVDAGDYDNDGKSEVVFSISGENRGGYALFYDDFKRHAVFEFSYH
jgi:hypothetical protein